MRRSGIGFAILSLLLAIGIGIGAYSIGYHHGLDVNGSVEVVRYAGWHGGGFFPFGLFLFPLFFIGVFVLLRGVFWRGGWGHHDHHGPWGYGPGAPMGTGGRDAFEDWHRRQHEPEVPQGGREGEEQAAT
jgi:hypothetical protein